MSCTKNNLSSTCNKRNLTNNWNKIYKNSTDLKKIFHSSKIRCGNCTRIKDTNENHNFRSSINQINKQGSKDKILRNIQCTNNIISDIEKLIRQNINVERGAKRLQANNINSLNKKRKSVNTKVMSSPVNNKYQNQDKHTFQIKFPLIEEPLEKHESIEEIMFSNTFGERSDSSQIEHERNKLLNLLTKEKDDNFEISKFHRNSTSTDQYFDCAIITSNNDLNHLNNYADHYQNSISLQLTDQNELMQSSSSKILINFKNLLNEYLQKKSTNETKFFLSKDDIEFLRNIIEADEKFHQLHKEDHVLLKEVLLSQLEEIQLHQNIVNNFLKTLRKNNRKSDRKDHSSIKSKSDATDAQEPYEKTHTREKCSTEDKSLDEITSEKESFNSLDEEEPDILFQKIIMNASKMNLSHKQIVQKKEIFFQQEFGVLDTIIERTESELKPPNLKRSSEEVNKSIGIENKKSGVTLNNIRIESYVIIENLSRSTTVYPVNIAIITYTALEFVKQCISLETLKKLKDVYIPKIGNQFELEKVDYEHLISNPEKLQRVLKIHNKSSEEITEPINSDESPEKDIDQIGLIVALYECYCYIVQSIEELNNVIKNEGVYSHSSIVSNLGTSSNSRQQFTEEDMNDNCSLNEESPRNYDKQSLDTIKNKSQNLSKNNIAYAKEQNDFGEKHFPEYFDEEVNHLNNNIFFPENEISKNEEYKMCRQESSSDITNSSKLIQSSNKSSEHAGTLTLIKTTLAILFQSSLFAFIIFVLSLKEPVCL